MAVFTVTNLSDSGAGSLRQAVLDANASVGVADTIEFSVSGTIVLTSGELSITDDLIIDGDNTADNKADITISGNDASRIFNIQTASAVDVDLLSLTLTNGLASGGGYSDRGGAVHASGPSISLDIVDTTIKDSVGTYGGGLLVNGGTLNVANSLFQNNHATNAGGGLNIFNNATATLTNTTLYQNTADGNGGGLRASGGTTNVVIYNSTIVDNQADANGTSTNSGGAIDVIGGGFGQPVQVNIFNTIISGNTSGSGGSETLDSFSGLVGDVYFSYNDVNESLGGLSFELVKGFGSDPKNPGLAFLTDNGGTTQTIGLTPDSDLIGEGGFNRGAQDVFPEDPLDLDGDAITAEDLPIDANGRDRVDGSMDIGAVEFHGLVVDNIIDEDDGDYSAGDLSLREAIGLITTGGITFDASLAGQTIVLNGTQLDITSGKHITIDGDIDGDNKADITLSGNNASRIFSIGGAATDVDLLSLNLTNGSGVSGGAIYGNGFNSLDIADSVFTNNQASFGGAIVTVGGSSTTTISNSLFNGNFANVSGGAAYFGYSATANLINTTVVDNIANDFAGGIALSGSAIVNVINSTVTDNQADANGASTILGGGILNSGGTLNLTNSVVAENTSGTSYAADDVRGNIDNAANSFIGTNETILAYGGGGSAATINNGGSPLLGALLDNGGTVHTRAILNGSPLINAGDNALIPTGVTTDANGGPRTVAGTVDIGATEFPLAVTSALDTGDDATIGASLQADSQDGDGLSLREAIHYADAGETITFGAAVSGQTIVLGGTQLAITQDVRIDGDINGDEKADIAISGNNASRIFNISGSGTDARFDSLTLTQGDAGARGGAIYASDIGSLQIAHSSIVNNNSTEGAVTVDGNFGAIITHSLIANNTGTGFTGAGLYARDGATVSLDMSTVYGNDIGSNNGGGIGITNATVTLANSTVTHNYGFDGAGVNLTNSGSVLNVYNSVIAENIAASVSPTGIDVRGTVLTSSHSFFENAVSITNDFGGNFNGVGLPQLGQLLDNGGAVLTRSPLDGSPLIDAGDNFFIPIDVADINEDGDVFTDALFDGRLGTRIVNGTVDIGAVEHILDETIVGTANGNTIIGGLGMDHLTGLDGNDIINGGDGDDFIRANGGMDAIYGGNGNDDIDGGEGNDTVFAGNGNDIVAGSGGVDSLFGQAGDDTVRGGNGNDTVNGGGGVDDLFGDANDDTIFGGAGNDSLNGGGGADELFGQDDNDTMLGGNGDDTLDGGAGDDTLFGQANVDILRGNIGNDTLNGGGGNDFLFGQAGNDVLYAGVGNDLLTGGGGDDRLFGEDGDDRLFGGGGADELFGGAGADFVVGNSQVDLVDGGSGNDTVLGDAGNDRLLGSTGDDVLDGGDGDDDIFGQADNDRLLGNNGNDTLGGGGGNDELFGQAGNDTLDGGTGNDSLGGGGGIDNFVFLAGWGQDTITDFANGIEKANVSGAGVTAATINVATVGANAVVDFGGTDTITFVGLAGNIDVGDFIF